VSEAETKVNESELEGEALMEQIDQENRQKMAEMIEEEILELQRSLQASLLPPNPREKLIQKHDSALSMSQVPSSTPPATSSTAQPPKSKKPPPKALSPPTEDDYLIFR
jgi:RPAP1-like, N-terminal